MVLHANERGEVIGDGVIFELTLNKADGFPRSKHTDSA